MMYLVPLGFISPAANVGYPTLSRPPQYEILRVLYKLSYKTPNVPRARQMTLSRSGLIAKGGLSLGTMLRNHYSSN
jgi:hypothetical protein